jgi:predicted AAA+ superfamily ATPase
MPLTLDFTKQNFRFYSMKIERVAKETLLRLAGQFPVVGITGPRQSGKTTLAKMVFPEKNIYHLMIKQFET